MSRADQTRQRLLRAAVEAFAERGFHGTTTRDLAAAAGMSPAAVYVHYPSKEDLLFQLSLTGHERTLAVLDAADAPGAAPGVRLAALIRAFVRYHAEDHTWARIVNYELGALTPEHLARITTLRRAIARRLRAAVDAGVASGDFATDDPATVTLALESMGIDIGRWYSDDRGPTPEALAESYSALALRMVQARGQ
ncbi:TetR/AcrR family transcriptional regulator [Gordonia sp. PP30]|nr:MULTISPECIES: TetR/AcrR family transcriptional regulator [unclassified Gordonia (in: high G+C Gram-positive bacteria)]UQE77046.1 TetR/AcrR family transcriptional regulator [Gordonia sp. PP30]